MAKLRRVDELGLQRRRESARQRGKEAPTQTGQRRKATSPIPTNDTHSSINYNDELFRGEATGAFEKSQQNDPLETPSEKRRRLLGQSAAGAVLASRERFENQVKQKEKEMQAESASNSKQVRIKTEEEDAHPNAIVIESSDEEDQQQVGKKNVPVKQEADLTVKTEGDDLNGAANGETEDSRVDSILAMLGIPNPANNARPSTPPQQSEEDEEGQQAQATPEPTPTHNTVHEAAERANETEEGEKPPLERTFPWPEHFLELEKTFKALNTVYAFCSGRKHMATTYDTLKSSVQGLLNRPLEIMDIAQIKSLCSDLINFAYVEQELLQVHNELPSGSSMGKSRRKDIESMTGREKFLAHRAEMDDIYAQVARNIEEEAAADRAEEEMRETMHVSLEANGFEDDADEMMQSQQTNSQALMKVAEAQSTSNFGKPVEDFVLFFEFNDGTLKGPKATARGKPGMRRGPSRNNPKGRPNPKLYEIPSAAAMTKLIEKRNFKFEQAVLELLTACMAKEEDPVQLIISAAEEHIPVNPELGTKAIGETPRKRKMRLEFFMKNPDQRPPISEVIEELRSQVWYKDQIVAGGRRSIASRPARYDQLTFMLSQEIVNALWATRQIEEFYLHQADALNALDENKSIIVCTSTSSGKSLIYQIPVLRALQEDYESTAMYIFPTKALAQDQKRTLQDLLLNCDGLQETIVATYDGDTPKELRQDIRDRASVIFTNPDMLHQSILPNEYQWRRFLRGLRFVVVDELHMYNGLFGAHVSFVMRRLRRMCHALGNRNVRFVSCSATVANPAEHMRTLFGIEEVEVITEDGSPAGNKEWLIWNPPLIDDNDPKQGRVSAYAETSKVFRHLVERGVRTIIFTKVRRTCEIVMNQIRNDLLLDNRQDVVSRVMSYRSGYSPEDRRKIEQDMFKGALLGIVATSALELGIDIGTLDAVIMLGFPYSISSLRQQAGRAGRRQKDSLAVLIGDPFPMDQHYMRNPEEIFSQPDTILSVDLKNDFVLESHLQCAAMEMPLQPEEDAKYFGDEDVIDKLCATRLEQDKDGFYHCRPELRPNPAREVALRGARQLTYIYIDDSPNRRSGPRVMEEVEVDRAIFEAFEGAVFMHQGLSYICQDIDHEKRIARMKQANVNYHTRPRDHTDTDAMETHRIRALRDTNTKAYYGHVRIATHVWGYFKVDKRANILDEVSLESPPFIRDTKGLWLDVPAWLVNALIDKTINAAAAIHAAEHALLSLTPMFVVSLAGDVRTECKVAEREYARKPTSRKRPARLIFYDTPGLNGGVCVKAFEHLDGLIRIAISVIESCPCVEGCPSCVTSQTCAHANLVTSKVGALGVLRGLVGLEPFDADLPMQNEPGHAEGHLNSSDAVRHTIAEAAPVRTINGTDLPVEQYEEHLPPTLQAILDRAEAVGGVVDNEPRGSAWERQNQRHRQQYAAPPVGKSMRYDDEDY
ncbi:P-loop containing nucleoside triphosphate hydrolase protein [Meira miltonrushii]|uniref:P-loop containing nucleoside triphosphate hydrolase protein n=1 Tax=Meira miltonrushii TaxID=1280837 RepID=A0A316VE91_9BASI|nr:P-loop containing nucleoside triphosphate hydrolase protein [Meira miltonrushii]PWN33785.1 P-loop containing nucleoside triphosphate hydrolase protein [Meira miltonrushii]